MKPARQVAGPTVQPGQAWTEGVQDVDAAEMNSVSWLQISTGGSGTSNISILFQSEVEQNLHVYIYIYIFF